LSPLRTWLLMTLRVSGHRLHCGTLQYCVLRVVGAALARRFIVCLFVLETSQTNFACDCINISCIYARSSFLWGFDLVLLIFLRFLSTVFIVCKVQCLDVVEHVFDWWTSGIFMTRSVDAVATSPLWTVFELSIDEYAFRPGYVSRLLRRCAPSVA